MCRLQTMSTLWLLRYIVTVLMTVPLGAEGLVFGALHCNGGN